MNGVTFVTADECRELRRLAREGHYATAISRHFSDRSYPTVRTHAFGYCTHLIEHVGEPATNDRRRRQGAP